MKIKVVLFIIICSVAGLATMVVAKEMQAAETCQSTYVGFEAVQHYTELADIASHTGKLDEAITAYSCALEIESGYQAAYYGRGMAYQEQGQYELALNDFLMVLDYAGHYPLPEDYLNVAKSHDALGDTTQALAYYSLYLEDSDNPRDWVSVRIDELS